MPCPFGKKPGAGTNSRRPRYIVPLEDGGFVFQLHVQGSVVMGLGGWIEWRRVGSRSRFWGDARHLRLRRFLDGGYRGGRWRRGHMGCSIFGDRRMGYGGAVPVFV